MEKYMKQLEGAKKHIYLSDDVTHCLVASPGPAETSELQDIYDIHEIPVIKVWLHKCSENPY